MLASKPEDELMRTIETLPAPSDRTTDRADFRHPIEFLCGEHERQRWFCEQLVTLAEDIRQLGHENLAASLLDFAIVDIANNMDDEANLLGPALLHRCVSETGPRDVVTELGSRHQSVATLVALTIDGLDRLASGDVPLVPRHFIMSILGLVEMLMQNLDWEDNVLLPLAALRLTVVDQRDLGLAMARRHGASSLH